jgi:hypothetical protein
LLLHPINRILCFEELRGTATPAEHDHHHDGAAAHSHSSEPKGDVFEHCKDALFGIAVASMQPFALPSAPPPQVLYSTWFESSQHFVSLLTRTPPVPFHPPRA